MPAVKPPSDSAKQLSWLVDREAIRDLISNFGVCVDDRDTAAYAANFTDDAVLDLPFGRFEGRQAIAAMQGPPAHWRTHHLFGNIVIELAEDRATTRAYVMATHVFAPDDKTDKAHSGGWYEHKLVRCESGWRFSAVRLIPVWEDTRPMMAGQTPPSAASA